LLVVYLGKGFVGGGGARAGVATGATVSAFLQLCRHLSESLDVHIHVFVTSAVLCAVLYSTCAVAEWPVMCMVLHSAGRSSFAVCNQSVLCAMLCPAGGHLHDTQASVPLPGGGLPIRGKVRNGCWSGWVQLLASMLLDWSVAQGRKGTQQATLTGHSVSHHVQEPMLMLVQQPVAL
jgi:hypothetical protein